MTTKHPWMAIQEYIQSGDEEAAREALQNADSRLSGRMRISAEQAIKRAFPEGQPEFKSAEAKRSEQNEAGNNSPLADSLARRRAARDKQAEKFKGAKKSVGWNVPVPVGEEDHYTKPESGGFNLPVNDAPSRRGAGRQKVSTFVPGSGGAA
jgi:hypothetical protein